MLLTEIDESHGKVMDAIKMFESHPSVIAIKKHIVVDKKFTFLPISLEDVHTEFKALNTRKSTRHMNIPIKQIKEVMDIVDKPLQGIWNNEILKKLKFPDKLKLADITPLHKKLETVLKENYRPVSVLAVVSKIFERIMDKQTDAYMGKYLSRFICGYRKCHGPQHALLYMVEKWKKSLDNKGYACGVLMDLSKAFDTITTNYSLQNYMHMALMYQHLK